MYLNDVSGVMGTVNWCIANTENENEDKESVDSQTARAIINERKEAEYFGGSDDSDDDDDKEHVNQASKVRRDLCFLTGPFTETQATIARQRTQVCFQRIKNALIWLKANN
jgi:hypothetical protein